MKNNQLDELKDRSKNYIVLYTCLAIGFILLTPEVFTVFASKEYQEGVKIIPIVVLSCYAIFVYSFSANYEFCFKRTDMVAIGSAIAGICNILLNYILIKKLNYMGAAIATLISNLVLVVIHTAFAKRIVKEKWVYSYSMFVPPLIGLFVAVVLFYCCFTLTIIRWFAAFCCGVLLIFKIYKQKSIF